MTESHNKRKTGLSRLIEIAGSKKWWLIGSMVLSVIASVLQFIPFISVFTIMKELAGNAVNPALIDKAVIWKWGYVSLFAVILYGITFFISNMLSHIAAFNILYEIRIALAKKLVRLPLGFFTKRSSGEIKKVMSEDVERIELFVAHHIPDFTSAFVFPILMLGFLFFADWRLALVVIFVFLFAAFLQVSMSLSKKAEAQTKEFHKGLGKINSSIVEYVRGIQVIKIFNNSIDTFEKLKNDISEYRDLSIGMTRSFKMSYTGFLTIISSTLLFLVPASIFALTRSSSYSSYIPTVLMFLILGAGMFFPLLKLMFIGSMMTQNTVGVGIVDEILDKPEIVEPVLPLKPADSSIEFRNVSFSYGETTILNNISFLSPPGTVTALVGPSGAGKSTIAMLTARFWDVQSGEILIGKVPVKDIANEVLMDNISFVFQDTMLFFDTIEENIRMGNSSASMEEVVSAAKAACCHEFIGKLEHGYKTLVGEGGTYLSGGEQQRIALARAILKNAPIVLLDEATAYADPENEGKILEAFSHLIKGKTVVVIAHRLSTITNADQILVIDKGIIAEQGKHEELKTLNGLYRKMWDTYTASREWELVVKGEK